jgi:hypothetical protein
MNRGILVRSNIQEPPGAWATGPQGKMLSFILDKNLCYGRNFVFVLSPVEQVSEDSPGSDYHSKC